MHNVADALRTILECTPTLAPRSEPIGPDLLGLVLAENVSADCDSPPFAKAMMDGYAVRSADLAKGSAELQVVDEIYAGQVPTKPVEPGEAQRIMTGAPVPAGADAVVMVERTTLVGTNRVQVNDSPPPGHNILPQACEMKAGEVILGVGAPLGPTQLGLLAALGQAHVSVVPRPRVAVVATGDEIVEVGERPGPGKIRNSNGTMLLAQVARAGGLPHWLGIVRDDEADLRERIVRGLEHDVLILTGGVSAGKADLVPKVLADLGARAHVAKVRLKPGKPMLFARGASNGHGSALVFGLPGNPVSSYVCFELFVRPALRKLRMLPPGPLWIDAELTETFSYKTDRPTYHPAHVERHEGVLRVRRVPWFGSADLRGMSAGNALMRIDEGIRAFHAGQSMPVLRVDQPG